MAKQTITITISGPLGSGKTTLARLIKQFFEAYNIEVVFENPDKAAVLPCLRKSGRKVSENTKVFIKEVSTTKPTTKQK